MTGSMGLLDIGNRCIELADELSTLHEIVAKYEVEVKDCRYTEDRLTNKLVEVSAELYNANKQLEEKSIELKKYKEMVESIRTLVSN